MPLQILQATVGEDQLAPTIQTAVKFGDFSELYLCLVFNRSYSKMATFLISRRSFQLSSRNLIFGVTGPSQELEKNCRSVYFSKNA